MLTDVRDLGGVGIALRAGRCSVGGSSIERRDREQSECHGHMASVNCDVSQRTSASTIPQLLIDLNFFGFITFKKLSAEAQGSG